MIQLTMAIPKIQLPKISDAWELPLSQPTDTPDIEETAEIIELSEDSVEAYVTMYEKLPGELTENIGLPAPDSLKSSERKISVADLIFTIFGVLIALYALISSEISQKIEQAQSEYKLQLMEERNNILKSIDNSLQFFVRDSKGIIDFDEEIEEIIQPDTQKDASDTQ